jgi:hypothetical protein
VISISRHGMKEFLILLNVLIIEYLNVNTSLKNI